MTFELHMLHQEDNGRGGVLNTKQGFEDSEAYAELEKKLAKEVQEYWADEFEDLEQVGGFVSYEVTQVYSLLSCFSTQSCMVYAGQGGCGVDSRQGLGSMRQVP